jgi:glycosyltransferase involved in cell wall biosynthesis
VRILITVTSLQPDYGGPAFSVSGLAVALAEAGAQVGLWASDQSAAVTPLLNRQSCVLRITGTAAEALDRFGHIDILHDNGIWLPHNHRLAILAAKRGISRIVSTRGMLEPWALKHKGLKKRLAWWLYQRRDLTSAHCHHTTAGTEGRNLQRMGLGVRIVVVPNGVDVPPTSQGGVNTELRQASQNGIRTALFLGRIYPIKGLPMLIEAWRRVRPEGWRLRISGPDEGGHRKELERAVSSAGLDEVISFTGPVEYQMKASCFFDADLFILPTHSESFGIVVAEALAHGVPVLTTTSAPWSILPEEGCGWWVDANVEGLSKGLCEATRLPPEMLVAMGEKGRQLVITKFSWKRIANLMLSIYEGLLANVNQKEGSYSTCLIHEL